eukprot:351132-Chlamydomonas_euryale.AAC.4
MQTAGALGCSSRRPSRSRHLPLICAARVEERGQRRHAQAMYGTQRSQTVQHRRIRRVVGQCGPGPLGAVRSTLCCPHVRTANKTTQQASVGNVFPPAPSTSLPVLPSALLPLLGPA